MVIDCLAVFFPILITTGKINFQAGKETLLTFEFFKNATGFQAVIQGSATGSKFYRLPP